MRPSQNDPAVQPGRPDLARRAFLRHAAMGAAVATGWTTIAKAQSVGRSSIDANQTREPTHVTASDSSHEPSLDSAASQPAYRGPNVILVRFGGGVRRREAIDPAHTYSPYFLNHLAPQGVFYPNMTIDRFVNVAGKDEQIDTSHGQGTLHILTGKYDKFHDVDHKFLGGRFESKVPTLFEYFRKQYDVAPHEALIVNGEDRTDEEFYSFSNHHLFGARFRSSVLSLYRYKVWLLRRQLEEGVFAGQAKVKQQAELQKLEALDYRRGDDQSQGQAIEQYWADWRRDYRDKGFVNERGDRLLTQLALRAMKSLRPRLMMINYNDPDYVHWGFKMHYTRGISVIDDGLKQLTTAVQADPFYRDNTVFAVLPDCGRDNNRAMAVPCQHHFNSASARQIFACVFGAGIPKGIVVKREVDQTQLASTLAARMGFASTHADSRRLEEVLA